MTIIDLRSDTVTHPTPEMREAIYSAEIGDDVFGDDPSVNELEQKAANMMGKEAAVFVSSGTMGNLISVLAHAGRGDEIILGDKAHIFRSEGGGAAALGGISYNTVRNDESGTLNLDEIESAIRDSTNHHNPHTKMITIENTHNNCGGKAISAEYTSEVANIAHANGLQFHIDGARIFNAAVKLETPVKELVKDADSLSFCLSKGLSCPVGSVVCGTVDFINEARRWRKVVGGGTRQAGFMAVAGIVALDTMVERLADDHVNAQRLSAGLSELPFINIDPSEADTNLVFFDVEHKERGTIAKELKSKGILGGSNDKRWRFVTHYGIEGQHVDRTLEVMREVLEALD